MLRNSLTVCSQQQTSKMCSSAESELLNPQSRLSFYLPLCLYSVAAWGERVDGAAQGGGLHSVAGGGGVGERWRLASSAA